MENSSFIKQAKSDIFKELYTIINFYIKKGAKPQALKKYYRNSKRFNDILEDIKNKGINLVKDESEYKNLVKQVLNEILDDFIAKEKDEEYRNKQSKMKHIKEFNSFEINESAVSLLLSAGAIFFFYKFLKGFLKDIKERTKTSDEKINDLKASIYNLQTKSLENIIKVIEGRWSNGEGTVELKEDIVYYTIIFNYPDKFKTGLFKETFSTPLIIKINKNDSTIKWNLDNNDDFTRPIQMKRIDMEELINGIKEDIKFKKTN